MGTPLLLGSRLRAGLSAGIAAAAVALAHIFLGSQSAGLVPYDYPLFLDILFSAAGVVALYVLLGTISDVYDELEETSGYQEKRHPVRYPFETFRLPMSVHRLASPKVALAAAVVGGLVVEGLIIVTGSHSHMPYWGSNILFGAAHGMFVGVALLVVYMVRDVHIHVRQSGFVSASLDGGYVRLTKGILELAGWAMGLLALDAVILSATVFATPALYRTALVLFGLVVIGGGLIGLWTIATIRRSILAVRDQRQASVLEVLHGEERRILGGQLRGYEIASADFGGLNSLIQAYDRLNGWPINRASVLTFLKSLTLPGIGILINWLLSRVGNA